MNPITLQKNVSVLIIDDEAVTIATTIFLDDFTLKCKRPEFNYSLHSKFREGGEGENIGVKTLRFKDEDGSISFSELKSIFNSIPPGSFYLIFMDLLWGKAGEECSAWNQLKLKIPDGAYGNGQVKHGLIFANYLMSLEEWRGLLCVATGNTNPNLANIEQANGGDRYWSKVDTDVRSGDSGVHSFNQGIEMFEQLFGSKGLIRWWLHPPGDVKNWFEGERHNPGVDETDYRAVQRRFGDSSLWTDDSGRYSKTLFRVPEVGNERVRSLLNKPFPVPAEVIRMVLGGTIGIGEDLRGKDVSLPCMPALPFLFAVKTAFDCAHEESGETSSMPVPDCCLKQLGSNRFGFVMKQERDASELVRLVNQSSVVPTDRRIGKCERGFRNALRASVDCPEDLVDRPLASFLGGFPEPIAELEWSQEEKELRVSWPVE